MNHTVHIAGVSLSLSASTAGVQFFEDEEARTAVFAVIDAFEALRDLAEKRARSADEREARVTHHTGSQP